MLSISRTITTGIVVVFCALVVASPDARNRGAQGHWQGAIRQPAGELPFVVELSGQGNALTGFFSMPAVGAFRWPLNVTLEAAKLRFRLPTGLAFDGEVAGETITGTVPSPTGGFTNSFVLKRDAAPAVPYTEETDVSFRSGEVVLTGTIRVPRTPGRHAAVFLMQGSGPVDREGESFYADHFARNGIVTLVYDKRGTGRSGGDFRKENFDDFAADALAGVRYLQGRPEVDPKRVGLYGRSHGGMVAPLAAATSTDVAFIINVSGAGVSPHRQVTYQAEAQMRRDGFSDADIAEALAYMKLKWEVARTGGERWAELQAATLNIKDKKWASRVQPATKLEDIVPSWKLQMGYDPMPALERVKCPVLAIFGEEDTLTPVTETLENYRRAFDKAGNRNVTIRVFPKADHAMLVWPGTNDSAHWPTLAPGYVEFMTEWIRKTTSPPAQTTGPPVQGAEPDFPLVAKFDRNADRRLDRAERAAAREYLKQNPQLRKPTRGSQLPRGGSPGPKVTPKEARAYPASVSLYDPGTIRSLFLQFENEDWEQELEAFYHTDVLVPATLIVDNRTYADVGVAFRGNNSFGNVAAGLKRPLSITMDWVRDQHLLGHRSLNLLNSNQDPTFLRSVLYLDVARDYIPALRANFVRVAVNGESWGLYINQQTFSAEAEQELFKTTKGVRWKSPNNSVGGGFSYLGDDVALYRRWYEMKSAENPAAWRAMIHATSVLHQTPVGQLESALAPVMDVDAVLKFLALDIALANGDGYWNDGSDFNVYLKENGRFLFTPHDANEGFRARGGNAAQPDPLVNLTDPNKALRHKLLAVPALRDRYLRYVGDIAEKWLDWNRLGPLVERYQQLIADDVARDTRKHETTEAFVAGIHGAPGAAPIATTIRGYAEIRRAILLAHPDIVRARAAK